MADFTGRCWSLSDESVNGFADQVGVSIVSGVLLDQVSEYPAEAGGVAVWPAPTRDAQKAPVGGRSLCGRACTINRAGPDIEKVVDGVVGCGVPLPTWIGFPIRGCPGLDSRFVPQPSLKPVVLDVGKVAS